MPHHRILVTASVLSADFGQLQNEVSSVERAGADALQIDVMDGHFVPNLTFGAPVMRHIKTSLPLDIHLMVTNPVQRVQEFKEIGAKHITFHAETVDEPEAQKALIRQIRQFGMTCGIALKIGTPVAVIDRLEGDVDLVLVMSVEPGFAGQTFDPKALEHIRILRKKYPRLSIQVDGGITPETARLCREAGADNLVAATAIFHAEDRAKAIAQLRG